MTISIYTSEDMTVETGQTTGSVTSVNVSGGSSGLVYTGGPIISSGTITLTSGILTTPYGGTGFASATAGEVLYGNDAGTLGHNSNFFWSIANSRLGIGTNTPSVQLHTTDRAYIGTAVGTPPASTPIMQVGSNDWGIDTGRYGISFGTDSSTLTNSDTYSGCMFAVKNSSSTTPYYVVSMRGKAASSTNIQTVGFLSGNTYLENSTGTITANTVLAFLTNNATQTGGTRTVGSAVGARVGGVYTGGTTNITHYVNYFADGAITTNFLSGQSDFSNATVTNHLGFYYTAPTTGTNTNRWAFYAEDKNATISWSSNKFGFYQAPPASRSYDTLAPWGQVMAGPKSAFIGRVGIGYANPRFALDIATDDSDSFTGITFPSRLGITTSISTGGPNAARLARTGIVPIPLITTTLTTGSLSSPSAVVSSYYLGGIGFAGYNSADASEAIPVYVYGYADSNWTSAGNSYGGLAIGTGKGTARPNWFDRVEIDSAGVLRMYDQPYVRAYLISPVSVPTGSVTPISFTAHDLGEQGATARFGTPMHQLAVTPTRFIVSKPGIYGFAGQSQFDPDANGYRIIGVRKNGAAFVGLATTLPTISGVQTTQTIAGMTWMNANDYLELCLWQNSGISLNTNNTNEGTWFALYKLA